MKNIVVAENAVAKKMLVQQVGVYVGNPTMIPCERVGDNRSKRVQRMKERE